jgi:hypothetical protein
MAAGVDQHGHDWRAVTAPNGDQGWQCQRCKLTAFTLPLRVPLPCPARLAAGQTWLPATGGGGWRYLCEVSGEPGSVRYRLQSGAVRWAWAWEFREWCERHEAFLAPKPEATTGTKNR